MPRSPTPKQAFRPRSRTPRREELNKILNDKVSQKKGAAGEKLKALLRNKLKNAGVERRENSKDKEKQEDQISKPIASKHSALAWGGITEPHDFDDPTLKNEILFYQNIVQYPVYQERRDLGLANMSQDNLLALHNCPQLLSPAA